MHTQTSKALANLGYKQKIRENPFIVTMDEQRCHFHSQRSQEPPSFPISFKGFDLHG